MGDTLEIFGKEYTNVAGFKAKDGSGNTLTYTRGSGGGITPTGTINITTNGTHDVTNYASANVNVSSEALTLQSKTATPTESAQTITADSGYDGLSSVAVGAISSTYVGSGIARKTFTKADALAGLDDEGGYIFVDAGYYADDATISVGTANSTNKPTISINSATGLITSSIDIESGWVGTYNAGTRTTTQQLTTQVAKTVTPTESSQTAVAAGVYTTGAVTVGAISSTYVGTGISRKDGDDLTASGATVTVPAGYYASQATKSVASGSAGTPTATKGTVSNHAITVTPSVTNTEGYITGGTKNGTAVTVSASELVSGTKSITANGTGIDVTNYAGVDVNVEPNLQEIINVNALPNTALTISPDAGYDGIAFVSINAIPSGSAGTPTAEKGTVSNHSITVTPSVTNTTGYITGGTKSGTGVTVSASELVSGSQTITANGNNIDVTNLASVNVALTFSTIYTGTSTPSSSTGSNGDIYIITAS